MIGAAVAAAAPAVVQEAVAAILAAMRVAAVVAAAVAAIISPWAAGLAAPREKQHLALAMLPERSPIQSQLRGRQTRRSQAETRSVQELMVKLFIRKVMTVWRRATVRRTMTKKKEKMTRVMKPRM